MDQLTIPDGLIDPSVAPSAGMTAAPFETPGGNTVTSFILQPTPITQENLNLVVDGGWIDLETLCAQIDDPSRAAPICQEGGAAASPMADASPAAATSPMADASPAASPAA